MVIGDEDSPIIPVLLYIPSLMPSVSRECLKQKVFFFSFFLNCLTLREASVNFQMERFGVELIFSLSLSISVSL